MATDFETMVREGDKLAAIAPNVVVKLPLTWDGLRAARNFADKGIKTNVTLCFSAAQAMLAAKAGATFVSPLRRASGGPWGRRHRPAERNPRAVRHHGFETEILAASLSNPGHVSAAAIAGADAATLPADTFKALIKHPLTDKGLDAFLADGQDGPVDSVRCLEERSVSVLPDLSLEASGPHWLESALAAGPPADLLDDRSLLEEVGLKPHGRNVVEFGRAALTQLEEVAEREADARKRIESIARANFRRPDPDPCRGPRSAGSAQSVRPGPSSGCGGAGPVRPQRRGRGAGKPGPVPFGWRALDGGGVDGLLGEHGLTWLAPNFDGLNLFGAAEDQVRSVALIRMTHSFRAQRQPPVPPCAPSARLSPTASPPPWAAKWWPSSPVWSNAPPSVGRCWDDGVRGPGCLAGASGARAPPVRLVRWRPMAIIGRLYVAFLERHRGETLRLADLGTISAAEVRAHLAERRAGDGSERSGLAARSISQTLSAIRAFHGFWTAAAPPPPRNWPWSAAPASSRHCLAPSARIRRAACSRNRRPIPTPHPGRPPATAPS